MTTILAVAKPNGGLEMSDYQRASLQREIKKYAGTRLRIKIEKETIESRGQRKMFEGAYIPLWVFLDGHDYKDGQINDQYREIAKREFNGEWINVAGKSEKVGRSTKGILNDGFLNRLGDFLEEQYGVDKSKVLNPEHYKHWRDTVYPFGGPDTYIEYLQSLNIL